MLNSSIWLQNSLFFLGSDVDKFKFAPLGVHLSLLLLSSSILRSRSRPNKTIGKQLEAKRGHNGRGCLIYDWESKIKADNLLLSFYLGRRQEVGAEFFLGHFSSSASASDVILARNMQIKSSVESFVLQKKLDTLALYISAQPTVPSRKLGSS